MIVIKGKAATPCFKCNKTGHISSEYRKIEIHITQKEDESDGQIAENDEPQFEETHKPQVMMILCRWRKINGFALVSSIPRAPSEIASAT